MNLSDSTSTGREIARALVTALERALAPGTTIAELLAARDAAKLLALEGLDRVLGTLEPHAGAAWPAEAKPVVERLQRLIAESSSLGNLDPFLEADPELATIGADLRAIEHARRREPFDGEQADVQGSADPILMLSEVLEDLPIANDDSRERARHIRLTGSVATALCAALDWLAGDTRALRPIQLGGEGSFLELILDRVNHSRIAAADRVLAAVGGVLGPVSSAGAEDRRAGAWMIRVPTVSSRESYLMLIQGGIRLALPWHSVLRLRMVSTGEIESRLEPGVAVVEPFAPLDDAGGPRPMVLVALGLRRGLMFADRLVWRLEASPRQIVEPPPATGLASSVETEDGDVYWLIEPRTLLGGIESPDATAFGGSIEEEEVVDDVAEIARGGVCEPADVSPEPGAQIEMAPESAGQTGTAPESVEVTEMSPESNEPAESTSLEQEGSHEPSEMVEPLEADLPVLGPEDLELIIPDRSDVPVVEYHEKPAPRCALVAEDSITARIFLTRMLEQHGFEVLAVESATDLIAEMNAARWSVVFVDVELPEGESGDTLRRVIDHQAALRPIPPIVALVRDADDLTVAREAGIVHSLRKPFDRDAFDWILTRLGIAGGEDGGFHA